ncbi:hypothetical protein Tsubulata_035050 [Turnera subulata]|uniref:DUF3615 domain-containing protein n=1 Tax=Turnera subulata TaxID=218843 RepID=A0A9Q0FXT7_9ROSI|nr:hypothetical protein Tsubulata_035050 [Turnera subulata]
MEPSPGYSLRLLPAPNHRSASPPPFLPPSHDHDESVSPPLPPLTDYKKMMLIKEALERLVAHHPAGDPGAIEDARLIRKLWSPFDSYPHMDLKAYRSPWYNINKPWRCPEIDCPAEIAKKVDWLKLNREFGEDYGRGVPFDFQRYVEEGNPRHRPDVFMEASKMAVEYYNCTHLGYEIELVEPVGGKILMFEDGWEHFNFRAKSKNPFADQSIRLFFGEIYLGKRECGPNGVTQCVGKSQITQCTELQKRNTTYNGGQHFLNTTYNGGQRFLTYGACCHGCHPLDNIIHPFQGQGFLRKPPPSTPTRCRGGFIPFGSFHENPPTSQHPKYSFHQL